MATATVLQDVIINGIKLPSNAKQKTFTSGFVIDPFISNVGGNGSPFKDAQGFTYNIPYSVLTISPDANTAVLKQDYIAKGVKPNTKDRKFNKGQQLTGVNKDGFFVFTGAAGFDFTFNPNQVKIDVEVAEIDTLANTNTNTSANSTTVAKKPIYKKPLFWFAVAAIVILVIFRKKLFK